MKEITKEKTLEIIGGVSISAALFSALSKAANTVMDAGRYLGSAIRRIYSRNLCSVK